MSEWRARVTNSFATPSYSQEGEDIILKKLIGDKPNGFYVDVGAHHPQRFSNTYLFYKRGWRGINIDAMPGSMALFHRYRSRDINVESAIAGEAKDMTFFVFNEPALNTFDEALAISRNTGAYCLIKKIRVRTRTLADVLTDYLPSGQMIDFMTIDVEGYDLDVLKSNDWLRFKPACIAVECLGDNFQALEANPAYTFLCAQSYSLAANTPNTSIFWLSAHD